MFRRNIVRFSVLTVVALVLTVVSATVVSQSTSAVTKLSSMSPTDQAKAFAYYKALRNCAAVGAWKNSVMTLVPPIATKGWTMSASDAVGFAWFHETSNVLGVPPVGVAVQNVSDVGVIIDDSDGVMNCGGGEGPTWIGAAASLWGYNSGPDLLCALDFGRDVNQGNCTQITAGATNDFHAPGGVLAPQTVPGNLDGLWRSALGVSGTGIESIGAGEYQLYLRSFLAACRPISPGSGDYTIFELDEASNTLKPVKYGVGDRDRGTGYAVRVHHGLTMTCGQLATILGDQSSRAIEAYRAWLDENDGSMDQPDTGDRICDENGICLDASQTSCGIEGIGWLLCPILTAGAGLADSAYGFLAENFLATDPSLVNTDPDARTADGQLIGTGTYTAWGIMRSIANVAFVVAVLIIIFAQLSGLGVSNYGVKKLLPRVVIGAILVNLSFFLCQVAVDLSNIAGFSLKSLLEGVADQVTLAGGGGAAPTGDDSGNLAGIAATVLIIGSAAWINIGALIVAVVGAVISLLLIFVLLVVRKVLIVLLVVIAPLAFVAYLLPNTQPIFDKWRKLLTSLLLLFPIIGLLYGASILASAVLLQVAGNDPVLQIAAYLALVLPLVAVIPLLKGSLDGIGKLGGAIQSFGQKARGAGQSGAKSGVAAYQNSGYGKFRSGLKSDRKARIAAGTFRGSNRNPLNWGRNARARANSSLNQSRALNTVTGGFGANRELAAEAQNRKDQADAIAMFGEDDALVAAWSLSGGDDRHASFAALNAAQQAQFRKMRDAGHHRKATSHLAAAQYLSENGKGDAARVSAALAHARTAGANSTVVSGAAQAAIAAYRKSGRGDALAELSAAAGTPMTQQQGWGQVGSSAVHREGIQPGSAGRAAYEAHLLADPENARKALAGYDGMEARAQASAQAAIVAAAQMHQYNATGAAPTISNIQEAKDYFGVR